MARNYSNTYPGGALAGGISSGATSITLSSASGLPVATPYTLTIDDGSPSMEVVEVTGQSGVNLTVLRGVDGTSAVAHGLGATVTHSHTARDFREPALHAEASVAHGATGAVVGTTNAQTLTSKTLSAATNSLEGFTPSRFVTSDGSGRATATQSKAIPSGTVVGTSDIQTLTNKSLTSPTVTGTAVVANMNISGNIFNSGGTVEVNDDLAVAGDLAVTGKITGLAGRNFVTVRKVAQQTIANNTVTAISFDTEVGRNGFTFTAPSTGVTVVSSGLYLVSGNVAMSFFSASAVISVNVTVGGADTICLYRGPTSTNLPNVGGRSVLMALTAGQVIGLSAFHNQGVPQLTYGGTQYTTELSLLRVGD